MQKLEEQKSAFEKYHQHTMDINNRLYQFNTFLFIILIMLIFYYITTK